MGSGGFVDGWRENKEQALDQLACIRYQQSMDWLKQNTRPQCQRRSPIKFEFALRLVSAGLLCGMMPRRRSELAEVN